MASKNGHGDKVFFRASTNTKKITALNLVFKRVVAMVLAAEASCAKISLFVNTNLVKSVEKINLVMFVIVYTGLFHLFPVSSPFLGTNNTEERRIVCVHLRRVRLPIPGHSSVL